MSDIDLSSINWKRVDNTFSGILDGNGYVVSGMSDTLFKYVEWGIIKNLGISAELFDCSAALAVQTINASLRNCYFEGSITCLRKPVDELHAESAYPAAGLVYDAKDSTFISCYNAGDITAANLTAAGIVGSMGDGLIMNCFNSGTITHEDKKDGNGRAAGLVGSAGCDESLVITYCYNAGIITSNGDSSGIAGYASAGKNGTTEISYCYNAGDIEGFNYNHRFSGASGICSAGSINGGNIIIQDCYNSGKAHYGICGSYERVENVYIENCYNAGQGERIWPGAAIANSCKNLTNCYFFDVPQSISATTDGALFANVSRLTDTETKSEANYKGFNFDLFWQMGSGDYPYPVFRETDSLGIYTTEAVG